MARDFIADITPYFHSRPLVYVDGGAHTGETLRAFVDSGLVLREAHLIEPNPTAFAALRETAAEFADRIPRIRLHNAALGAGPGRLRMTDAGAMSRVIAPAEAEEAGAGPGILVDCFALDSLAWDFEEGHVSILKLDVEGSEPAALKGAERLLAAQAIDVIYIEAGFSADGRQQSYYRLIEDMLAGHGYRVFGIYQQTHEWPADSPFLRRVDLGFMSENFAARSPHALSREAYRLRQEKEALAAEAEALRAAAQAAEAEIATLQAEVGWRREAAEAAAAQAAAARTEREALAREHSRLLDYGRWLEKRYAETLASHSWRALEPARWLSRQIQRRKSPEDFVPRLAEPGAKASGGAPAAGTGAGPTMKGSSAVPALETRLWGGFSALAACELEALALDRGQARGERAEAHFALARWRYCEGDVAGALEGLRAIRDLDKRKAGMMRVILLETACLRQLGRTEEGRALAAQALAARPDEADLYLVMANCELPAGGEAPDAATDARRLAWANRIYQKAGLAPLRLQAPERGFSIDNLAADAPAAAWPEGRPRPRVSVIVPVYSAEATLPFVLRGLRAQTWAELEIVVVDDCSPDGTAALVEAIAAEDPRVKLVRQERNQGSYAARNAGLRAATGDYVTTHDADDWSHPQKIELQVRHFLDHPAAVACCSYWIRCEANMTFRGLYRPWAKLISKNISSFMFPRAVMERLGGWVETRIGADTELMRRTEAIFGPKALERIDFEGPLSFSLHEERSLTRQSTTHVRTVYYGVRKELQDAADHWRRGAPAEALTLDPLKNPRPFPVPATVLPERPEAVDCDLLFVGDLAMDGGAFESTFNYMRAAVASGASVGVFHWRRHDLDVAKPVHSRLRDLAQEGALRIVAPGERVRAKTAIVGYPVILRARPDLPPRIEIEDLVVVVNQMASRLMGGGDPQYDPEELRARAREVFGTEGIWAPISGLVQRLMREDARYPEPSATVWTPLIDTAAWCATPPRWRGAGGAQPVIGRHARDHYTKWPSTRAALAAAYCADRPCRVEIMGGATNALSVLGKKPANWTITRFGGQDSQSFLAGLDAFVHYPHEDYIEEFGRAALEALACGLPVFLPPVFEQTFGPAALYAEPARVWDRISALWADEAAWIAQGAAGQEFVRANSDWSRFPARLAATLAEAAARRAAGAASAGPDGTAPAAGAPAAAPGAPRAASAPAPAGGAAPLHALAEERG